MIRISDIKHALTAQIRSRTGIPVFERGLKTSVYPCYLISAQAKKTEPSAAGRQLWRQLLFSVYCAAGRSRAADEGLTLMDALYPAVLPHFSAAGRTFSPLRLSAGEEDGTPVLQFELEFYDLPGENAAQRPPTMDKLSFSLETRSSDP